MGHPPLMFRPVGGEAPPRRLSSRSVWSPRPGLEDFVTALIEAYPMPGAEGTSIADPAVLGGRSGSSSGVDGVPVGTAGPVSAMA